MLDALTRVRWRSRAGTAHESSLVHQHKRAPHTQRGERPLAHTSVAFASLRMRRAAWISRTAVWCNCCRSAGSFVCWNARNAARTLSRAATARSRWPCMLPPVAKRDDKRSNVRYNDNDCGRVVMVLE